MSINDNSMNLADYKGLVVACPFCPPKIDTLTRRAACSKCFGREFIAICSNCTGTGLYKGSTIWDGGQNPHTSTCNPCGGNGFFPAKGPATGQYIKDDKPGEPAKIVPLGAIPPTPGVVEMPINAPDGTHLTETTNA